MSSPERYIVEHETRYAYTAPVSQSWQLARLTPRMLPWQKLLSHSLQIDPPADERRDELDSFGNTVTHFGLHGAHRMLRVRMQCLVEITARPLASAFAPALLMPAQAQMQFLGDMAQSQTQAQGETQTQPHTQTQTQSQLTPAPVEQTLQSWEWVRDAIRQHPEQDDLVPASMTEPTQLVPLSEGARQYASKSFARGRAWLEGVSELMTRIHQDFEFEPGATTVSTSVDEVLYQRRGVCQDFAHLMLASLRGLGLPARYVSGYLLTEPPPGMPRLMGVDASHAWVAAYSPQHGWVEFDPTNNQLADQRYITLTWGADFADVVPLRGVILGGGDQRMDVGVSVIPT
jgi:transglutaminase-like putative cysteine protease